MKLPPLFDALNVNVTIALELPDIHEVYRTLRNQKNMMCGEYALTCLLWFFNITEQNSESVTVDQVTEAAGTVFEPRNADVLTRVEQQAKDGYILQKRVGRWTMHGHFGIDLTIVDDEDRTSTEDVVVASQEMSDGLMKVVPVPTVADDVVQLYTIKFITFFGPGQLPAQSILNCSPSKIIAFVGLLSHKYNLVGVLTQKNEISYFQNFDWDIDHFTTLVDRNPATGLWDNGSTYRVGS